MSIKGDDGGKGSSSGKGNDSGFFWEDAKPIAGITGNARWELLNARQNDRIRKELVVPVLVELNDMHGTGPTELARFLAERRDQYSLADHEMDYLASEANINREAGPTQLVILCRPDAVESTLWRVMHVGPPQARVFRAGGFYRGCPLKIKKGRLAKTPVMGVIDDGIGFLNQRFRRGDNTTRFEAMWIMDTDNLVNDPGLVTGPPNLFGIELTKGDINTRIASGLGEQALYRQINTGVFGPVPRKSTNHHAGHGTHVLDIATGAKTGDDMADVPILGVQLPPNSIAETSGRRLDPDIIQGLNWIVMRALQMPGRFALVINLSLGALAGPQDGTNHVELAIAKWIAFYHFYSGHAPIRVVVAYGNAYRSRLVAGSNLAPGATLTLDWRILPDDATDSYLEIRTKKDSGKALAVTLDPPAAGPTLTLATFPAPNVIKRLTGPRGKAAEVLNELGEHFDKVLIYVAPTVRDDTRPTAPPGAWRVSLTNTGAGSVDVSLKVQRDDTPAGYRQAGRQSWLDHPTAWAWEKETMAWSMPAADSPITREGTEVAYAGSQHPSVYFVGSARPDIPIAGAAPPPPPIKGIWRPSRFASEGAPPEPAAPTLSGAAEDGAALSGLRASGVLSGSTARMAGSSMAAPIVTRGLLRLAIEGKLTPQPTPGQPHNKRELADLLGHPPAPVADSRLGFGTVVLPDL
jgi:hypothetical protein